MLQYSCFFVTSVGVSSSKSISNQALKHLLLVCNELTLIFFCLMTGFQHHFQAASDLVSVDCENEPWCQEIVHQILFCLHQILFCHFFPK